MSDEIALLIADVYELAGALRRVGESTAATEGQTQARWQLLSAASEGGLTVPQAARRLGVTRQAVQRVANDLVADDLAAFGTNPDHRTSPLLTLTDRGLSVLAAITRRARRSNAGLAGRVDPAIVSATRDGIRQLIAAVADSDTAK